MIVRYWICVCFLFFLFFPFSIAVGQSAPPGSDGAFGMQDDAHPSRERPPLPDYQQPDASPSISFPPEPTPSGDSLTITDSPSFHLQKIRLVGNAVFSEDELSPIIQPYVGRRITFEALQNLRLKLTRHYVENGYVNSGVVIPDQKIENGEVVLAIIEGRLSEILVAGNEKIRDRYIRSRLVLGADPPLNIRRLEERVQLLHQDPIVDRLNAVLAPGDHPGEAVLEAHVDEASPYVLGIRFDNHESPSVGGERGEIYGAHRNLTGWGDALRARVGLAEGLDDLSLSYDIPLTARDTRFSFRYERNESLVVERPFDIVDIESESETFSFKFSHPFIQTPGDEFSLSLGLDIRDSETRIAGRPYSFSPGVHEGKSEVSVIRFAQDWVSRSRSQVFALRSVFNVGVDAFDATINGGDVPDGRFFAWLGQFQWARRFDDLRRSQLIFRADAQFSSDTLLPLEKFSVGGANSVRGYRENQLVRDNGVAASLECRIPLFRAPIPRLSKTLEDGTVQLAVFGDWGWAENVDAATPHPRTISSAGLGLRWDPSPKIHAECYWGHAFRDLEQADYDLQDDGIHFMVDLRIF